ncbi:peptidoglycan DD-metalloendopeptidase family protein [Mesonia aestuariivivens]|uniref:Peptidoglycan DD-metalloendopeptidase family protein n=1 Tax=Mesonia aestuariivivens TaxID=2796128 RepID=A0ABS6W4F7_9FLAO|nr:peptidoglycan DD-metalloendopeptidase family protein [Mesonia aestuariivivens]MBW2962599.1 peptidoglycan DD-metalloendopeptidase family protein [Mesonia aestuariivivens]
MLFTEFLNTLTSQFTPIIGGFAKKDYLPLDLSVTNKSLSKVDVTSSASMEKYIQLQLDKHQKKVAFGGYLEKRNLYRRSEHFGKEHIQDRDVHIGLDLWAKAYTSIFSPLVGEVHSFQNNTNFGDYGPTIILKHNFNKVEFYTLYGHLTLDSIAYLKVGTSIAKGQKIAELGKADVNGDYAPHLHFQVIKNLANTIGDYPGVCSIENLYFYQQNCPNPNLLLKLT